MEAMVGWLAASAWSGASPGLSLVGTCPHLWSRCHEICRAGWSEAAKALGVKFASAECGPSSLWSIPPSSIRWRASAIDKNHEAFLSNSPVQCLDIRVVAGSLPHAERVALALGPGRFQRVVARCRHAPRMDVEIRARLPRTKRRQVEFGRANGIRDRLARSRSKNAARRQERPRFAACATQGFDRHEPDPSFQFASGRHVDRRIGRASERPAN